MYQFSNDQYSGSIPYYTGQDTMAVDWKSGSFKTAQSHVSHAAVTVTPLDLFFEHWKNELNQKVC